MIIAWVCFGNRLFFDVCDGIYLDYGWKESSLEQSKRLSTELGRIHDVYVGVDVFGRFGNGGFDTVEVMMFYQMTHLCFLKRVLYWLQAIDPISFLPQHQEITWPDLAV